MSKFNRIESLVVKLAHLESDAVAHGHDGLLDAGLGIVDADGRVVEAPPRQRPRPPLQVIETNISLTGFSAEATVFDQAVAAKRPEAPRQPLAHVPIFS